MSERSPVSETTERRSIHVGPVISVVRETVRMQNGHISTLDIVQHPGACAVVPLLGGARDADPKILLIRQYRHATGRWLTEIPAGRLVPGESPDACARRELMEETGYRAGRLEHLTTVFTTPGFSNEQIHLFLARDLSAGDPAPEPGEFIEPMEISLSRALEFIASGEIADAKSALALLLVAAPFHA